MVVISRMANFGRKDCGRKARAREEKISTTNSTVKDCENITIVFKGKSIIKLKRETRTTEHTQGSDQSAAIYVCLLFSVAD